MQSEVVLHRVVGIAGAQRRGDLLGHLPSGRGAPGKPRGSADVDDVRVDLTDRYAIYEVTAGAAATTSYQFVARKTLAELDSGATIHGPAYTAALGGELGQAKVAALTASAVISQETDHFEFTPSQSVPPDAWVTANPGFWKPKAPAPADKKAPAEKKKP